MIFFFVSTVVTFVCKESWLYRMVPFKLLLEPLQVEFNSVFREGLFFNFVSGAPIVAGLLTLLNDARVCFVLFLFFVY